MRYLMSLVLVLILLAGCAKEAPVQQPSAAPPSPAPVQAAPDAQPAPASAPACTAGYVCTERYRASYQYENCTLSAAKECNDGCVNSACNSKSCIGTEMGSNLSNKGTVMLLTYSNDKLVTNLTYSDFCAEDGSVVEYYCDEGLRKMRSEQCDYPQKCTEGACV
jgi:hypothetical protein